MTQAAGQGRGPADTPDADPEDLAALARDWIALWQSELAAMAQDREMREAWTGLLGIWAATALGTIDATDAMMRRARAHDHAPAAAARPARPDEPPRPAPRDHAPDAGGDAVERLHRRIAELEARLAALERGDDDRGDDDRDDGGGRRD